MSAKSSAPRVARSRRKEATDVGGDVGARLRAQRERSGVGLRELARRLGVSPSAISQIETGRSRPSVSTLYAIVSELGMSLDELFSGSSSGQRERAPVGERAGATEEQARSAETASPSAEQYVQRAESRRALELETGVRWERLTRHADRFADFLYVIYDIGGSSNQGDRFIRHSGREYGLVLSGKLEVTVGFDTHVLGPGDSISFDSTMPHCLRNVGNEPVHGVWFVIGRQGDQRTLAFHDHLDQLPEPPPRG
jgi:transcriptional regulator with XRE-family HTH domain